MGTVHGDQCQAFFKDVPIQESDTFLSVVEREAGLERALSLSRHEGGLEFNAPRELISRFGATLKGVRTIVDKENTEER